MTVNLGEEYVGTHYNILSIFLCILKFPKLENTYFKMQCDKETELTYCG